MILLTGAGRADTITASDADPAFAINAASRKSRMDDGISDETYADESSDEEDEDYAPSDDDASDEELIPTSMNDDDEYEREDDNKESYVQDNMVEGKLNTTKKQKAWEDKKARFKVELGIMTHWQENEELFPLLIGRSDAGYVQFRAMNSSELDEFNMRLDDRTDCNERYAYGKDQFDAYTKHVEQLEDEALRIEAESFKDVEHKIGGDGALVQDWRKSRDDTMDPVWLYSSKSGITDTQPVNLMMKWLSGYNIVYGRTTDKIKPAMVMFMTLRRQTKPGEWNHVYGQGILEYDSDDDNSDESDSDRETEEDRAFIDSDVIVQVVDGDWRPNGISSAHLKSKIDTERKKGYGDAGVHNGRRLPESTVRAMELHHKHSGESIFFDDVSDDPDKKLLQLRVIINMYVSYARSKNPGDRDGAIQETVIGIWKNEVANKEYNLDVVNNMRDASKAASAFHDPFPMGDIAVSIREDMIVQFQREYDQATIDMKAYTAALVKIGTDALKVYAQFKAKQEVIDIELFWYQWNDASDYKDAKIDGLFDSLQNTKLYEMEDDFYKDEEDLGDDDEDDEYKDEDDGDESDNQRGRTWYRWMCSASRRTLLAHHMLFKQYLNPSKSDSNYAQLIRLRSIILDRARAWMLESHHRYREVMIENKELEKVELYKKLKIRNDKRKASILKKKAEAAASSVVKVEQDDKPKPAAAVPSTTTPTTKKVGKGKQPDQAASSTAAEPSAKKKRAPRKPSIKKQQVQAEAGDDGQPLSEKPAAKKRRPKETPATKLYAEKGYESPNTSDKEMAKMLRKKFAVKK